MPRIAVYIIESPSPINFLDGTSEGSTLCAALKHAGIRAELFTVINEKMLFEAAERVLGRLRSQRDIEPGVLHVLHLSMHGDTTGITLTDENAAFKWSDLGDLMDVFQLAAGGTLRVAMSTCHGFAASQMAHRDGRPPYATLVGPTDVVNWSDTVAAFIAYYHCLQSPTEDSARATRVMNDVIGTALFKAASGQEVQERWKADKLQKYMQEILAGLDARPASETTNEIRGLASSVDEAPRSPDEIRGLLGAPDFASILMWRISGAVSSSLEVAQRIAAERALKPRYGANYRSIELLISSFEFEQLRQAGAREGRPRVV